MSAVSAETVIWISGGSGGIGAALARHQPYPGARVINLDVVDSPDLETLRFDLTDPSSWQGVRESFETVLERPQTVRARFLHGAYAPLAKGLLTEVDAQAYEASLLANLTGSLTLSSMFVRAVRPGQDAGLMVMSSGAAGATLAGYSSYSASKVALEKWAEIVRHEIELRGWGPWVTALRPGLVDTPTARAASSLDPAVFPLGAAMQRNLDRHGVDADTAAQRIWTALSTPRPDGLISL